MRDFKGKSLIGLPNTYTVIDLETTGLTPQWDKIIEVAGIRVIDGMPVRTFSELIRLDCPLPTFITSLTGITDKMLAGARSECDVLADFFEFIGDSIVLAHNANFDVNFLYDKSEAILGKPFVNDFVCTLRVARKAYPSERTNTLTAIAHREGISAADHRALADSELLNDLYRVMRERLIKEHGADGYIELFTKRKFKPKIKAASITPAVGNFDDSHLLFDRYVAFTGTMSTMQRKDAMQAVADAGGHPQDRVTKQTNYLVIGSEGYRVAVQDGRSSKMKKADKAKLNGQDIEILSEEAFIEALDDVVFKALPGLPNPEPFIIGNIDDFYRHHLDKDKRAVDGDECIICSSPIAGNSHWKYRNRHVCSGNCNDKLKRRLKGRLSQQEELKD